MEFWGYYRVLRRRRQVIVAALLAAVAVAIVFNRPQIGDYAATATLSVPSADRFFFVAGVSDLSTQGDLNARTGVAINLVRSREVGDRVIRQLGLRNHPDELVRRISAGKDPISNLVKVTVTGSTPGEAITLANAVAEIAAAYDQEVQSREATAAREFVSKQAEGTHADLQAAENALVAFQKKNGIDLAIPRSTQAAGLETQMQQTDLSLRETQAKLSGVLAQMNGQSAVRSDREIADNPTAQQLRSQLVQLEVALTSELAVHTEKHPAAVALMAKIEALKQRLKTELSKVVASEQIKFNPIYDALSQSRINLETERLALLARREALQRAISEAARALPDFAQRQVEQTRLTRSIEILSKQFADLEGKVAQARIREEEIQSLGSLAVVDHARTAQPALLSGLRFKLTLATVLGLLGGAALAFFLEYLDNTVKTPVQAERLLGVPVLATVPRHNPPFDEAYRLLRINLAPHEDREGADAIVVTSPTPQAGTSTVVANLARAFAQAGRRTIVVDTDVRRPTQHAHFGVANDKGLVEVLTGAAPLQSVLAQTDVPNLWLLPSGTAGAEVGGFFSLKAMTALLGQLKQMGDVVLLDTPPAGAFSDALVIASAASGVLLVLKAGQAPRGVEELVKVQLDRLGVKVLGVVLTKVPPDLVDSYFYQERFYKDRPRRRLTPAAAAAIGALIFLLAMGMFGGTSVKEDRSRKVSLAIQHVIAWLHLPSPSSPSFSGASHRTGTD